MLVEDLCKVMELCTGGTLAEMLVGASPQLPKPNCALVAIKRPLHTLTIFTAPVVTVVRTPCWAALRNDVYGKSN